MFFNRIPIESVKICNSNVMHLGKKFIAAIFSAILFWRVFRKNSRDFSVKFQVFPKKAVFLVAFSSF